MCIIEECASLTQEAWSCHFCGLQEGQGQLTKTCCKALMNRFRGSLCTDQSPRGKNAWKQTRFTQLHLSVRLMPIAFPKVFSGKAELLKPSYHIIGGISVCAQCGKRWGCLGHRPNKETCDGKANSRRLPRLLAQFSQPRSFSYSRIFRL